MLTRVHPRVAGVLAHVTVSYDYVSSVHLGCQAIVPFATLRHHVLDQCLFRPAVLRHSPLKRVITPSARVSDILSSSLSKLKGDVSRKLMYHLISAQEEGGQLEVSTPGRSQTWVRLTKAGQPSSAAAECTLRRRSNELEEVRKVVSGASSATQQAAELQQLRPEERKQLLRDAGLVASGSLTAAAALAMKSDIHLPWYKLRHWLTSHGVQMESESAMRKKVSSGLPFKLIAEEVPIADRHGNVTL